MNKSQYLFASFLLLTLLIAPFLTSAQTASAATLDELFARIGFLKARVSALVARFQQQAAVGNVAGGTTCSLLSTQKLVPDDGAANDFAGSSVDILGNLAIVGAPGDDAPSKRDAGSAYIFRFNGASWVQESKIVASDSAIDDYFGTSVTIGPDVVVIGASGDDDRGENSGAAYIFHYNGSTWIQENKITANDGTIGDNFGSSIALSGNVVLVGATGDNGGGRPYSGSAYLFRNSGTTWTQEQKLVPVNVVNDFEGFSQSVDIDGNIAVVGAYQDDTMGTNAGAAYVYRYNTSTQQWVLETKLTASDVTGRAGHNFGQSVDVRGDVIAVGANKGNPQGIDSGSAYMFRYNPPQGQFTQNGNWLSDPQGATLDQLGYSIALSDNFMVAGAPFWGNGVDGLSIWDQGAVIPFAYSYFDSPQWSAGTRLLASGTVRYEDMLTYGGLAVSGNKIIAGASGHAAVDNDSGAAYVFDYSCAPTPTFTLTTTSAGTGSGSISRNPDLTTYPAGTTVTLTATPNPNSSFVGWSGAACTTGTVFMGTNIACIANFDLIPGGPSGPGPSGSEPCTTTNTSGTPKRGGLHTSVLLEPCAQ